MNTSKQRGSLINKATYCLQHADNFFSLSTWKTYVGWVEQVKRMANKNHAKDVTVSDIMAFLRSLHAHKKNTARNAQQGITAVFRHVFWLDMSEEFRRDFLQNLSAPLISKPHTRRAHAPRILDPIPPPEHITAWLALLPDGKPQRACLKIYQTGILPQRAAQQFKTSIPAMKRVLRIGRVRAQQECGIIIPTGAGVRTLRTANIVRRILAGESPQAICAAVGLQHLCSLTPYLRLAGVTP